MRKRFEQQLQLDQISIKDALINHKSKNALDELLFALKNIFCDDEYNGQLFEILEAHLCSGKQQTGRRGMDLWQIFVLAQVRLCQNLSYCDLLNLANNHIGIRQLMGIEYNVYGFVRERIQYGYQCIYDNVSILDDSLVAEINALVLDFGYKKVFKKKETEALVLKSDSFVVESTVHFPTDYNLLWDGLRKCTSLLQKYIKRHKITGWRKIKDWRYRLKGLMRELGKACGSGGKGKEERVRGAAEDYLRAAQQFYDKLNPEFQQFPLETEADLLLAVRLEHFLSLVKMHIGLVHRRIILGETIPHSEKLFSLFETYTEWVNKGKSNPNVELGKKLCITTDQYHLIVDHKILSDEQDRDTVLEIGSRLVSRYLIKSWSFDKGYWRRESKELLQLYVAQVVMPKLGKRNKEEEAEERSRTFKKLKNKHSAIESNINELEKRGLDRCPDKGFNHFSRYIGLGVCAYNLKKIGRELIRQQMLQHSKSAA